MKPDQLLLCTDMDRTVIPNGVAVEHVLARSYFKQFCEQPNVILVYVTGRHQQLVKEAIETFDLPEPDYAITDVGSKLYQIEDGKWLEWSAWEMEISLSWKGWVQSEIAQLLKDMPEIQLQEPSKQNTYKLSYYAAAEIDVELLKQQIQLKLQPSGIQANLIWSLDDAEYTGLLDILPQNASKLHAIQFLQSQLGLASNQVLFAGDSGNDLEVLVSAVPAVLVANASDAIKQEALCLVKQNQTQAYLFIAEETAERSGNYAAGVLQGVQHFYPELNVQCVLQEAK